MCGSCNLLGGVLTVELKSLVGNFRRSELKVVRIGQGFGRIVRPA